MSDGQAQVNIVGSHVRRLRQQQGMSLVDLQAELSARGWNIDRTNLGRLENSKRRVTDIEVAVLAAVLHVTVSELFQMTGG